MRTLLFLSVGASVGAVSSGVFAPAMLGRALYALPHGREHVLSPVFSTVLPEVLASLGHAEDADAAREALNLLAAADADSRVAWCPEWPDAENFGNDARRAINYLIGRRGRDSFPIAVWKECFRPNDFAGTVREVFMRANLQYTLIFG